jgi:membrane-associated phospholipid phosphatase
MKPPAVRFYPFDYLIIAYCAITTALVLVFGRPISNYYDELAFYIGVGLLAYVISRSLSEQTSRAQALFRLLYPVMLSVLFYLKTQGLIFLLFDRFFDADLVRFEQSIFGTDPTVYFDSRGLNVWVTEILSFCYFSYYAMIPGFFLFVFLRRDYRVIKEALAAVCITFFSSYLLFSLYPIEGPRWHFAHVYKNVVEGPFFRQLVNVAIDNGAVHGGCMPSSHTGVALVLMISCFRYYRAWGWVMLPIVIGLAAGTVWGRLHYVSDVVVGAAIGLAAVWIVRKYHDRWINHSGQIVQQPEIESAHVS